MTTPATPTDPQSDEALAVLALQAAGHGAVVEKESLEGPLDGPGTLFHAAEATAWVVSPARARAEARGRSLGHPLVRPALAVTERVVVLPRVGPPPADPAALLLAQLGSRVVTETHTLRDLLDAPETRADRALAKAGLGRRAIDRLLSASMTIEAERGPTLGGLAPGWLRTERGSDTPLVISAHRAEADGFPAIDLAALALLSGIELRDVLAQRGDRAARERSFDVLLLAMALREKVHGGADLDAEIASLVERLLPGAPETVSLAIDAPPAVDVTRFAPLGDGVPASHARFVLRALDGVSLAGSVVRVRTEPPIRAGRTRTTWEPRSVREARIDPQFSALRFDDEALFSATPRAIADRLVRHAHGVVLDGTCGAGLLAMAAARRSEVREVVGVDLDRRRVAMAEHNARVAGLEGKLRFVQGDVRELALAADTLILDPPWGGRDYDRTRTGFADLGLDVRPLVDRAATVILKLPPSFDVAELPPGFVAEVLFDERAVPKCLAAVRR